MSVRGQEGVHRPLVAALPGPREGVRRPLGGRLRPTAHRHTGHERGQRQPAEWKGAASQAPAALAAELAPEVIQMHSAGYRRASDLPDGRVLVVGGGNTGFQIAKELSTSHAVELAIGSRQTPLPQKLLGRDLFWWLTKLGLLQKSVETRLGKRAQSRDTLIGSSARELKRRYRVTITISSPGSASNLKSLLHIAPRRRESHAGQRVSVERY